MAEYNQPPLKASVFVNPAPSKDGETRMPHDENLLRYMAVGFYLKTVIV